MEYVLTVIDFYQSFSSRTNNKTFPRIRVVIPVSTGISSPTPFQDNKHDYVAEATIEVVVEFWDIGSISGFELEGYSMFHFIS